MLKAKESIDKGIQNLLALRRNQKTQNMNTENLEKINNLLDFAYYEISEMEQTNKTKFIKAAIELAVEKIQEMQKENCTNLAVEAKANCYISRDK